MTPHLRILLFPVPWILLFAPNVLKRVQKALESRSCLRFASRMRNCSRSQQMDQVQSLESPDIQEIFKRGCRSKAIKVLVNRVLRACKPLLSYRKNPLVQNKE